MCLYWQTVRKIFLQFEIYLRREFQQDTFGSIPDHIQTILDEIFRDLLCPPMKISEVLPQYNIRRTPYHIIPEFSLTVLADPQKHQQTP